VRGSSIQLKTVPERSRQSDHVRPSESPEREEFQSETQIKSSSLDTNISIFNVANTQGSVLQGWDSFEK